MILCVEGNIGSGKSTFMAKLKEAFQDREDVCFLDEPVDTWSNFKDEEGGIIEHYYKDQKAWGFSFQMLAYISRLSILRKALAEPKYRLIITERSLLTDKHVFCKMLFEQDIIHPIQYQIYQAWFDEFRTKDEYKFVYLRTSPEVAHQRVNKRGRKGESIPLEYLEECHRYHEEWLTDALILNADVEEADTCPWISMIKEMFPPPKEIHL
jgi:deoxynucleoside kinase